MGTAVMRAPDPIPPPDLRQLDQMPSLPEWLASRVASMKDEHQASQADGKNRLVPTLPASLILAPAERAEVQLHIIELDALCKQAPCESDQCEASTLVVLTKVMLALPSSTQNEAGAEASGEAFQAALDDVPTWAVAAAVRRWYRGDCGLDERGLPYQYHWRPAPAELRRIALAEKWPVQQRADTLRKLLKAEPLIEFSDEHCALMRARLSNLFSFKKETPLVGKTAAAGRPVVEPGEIANCGTSQGKARP